MAIQTDSSYHAANSLFVVDDDPYEMQQAPNGCPIEYDAEVPGFIVTLDEGLDAASCNFECQPFQSLEPPTGLPQAFTPILFHSDDQVKGLLLVVDGSPVVTSFHLGFFHYRANQPDRFAVAEVTG